MKKRIRIAAAAVLICLCAAFAWSWFVGSQPFRDLSADEIAGVTLEIVPLTDQVELERQEIEELTRLLHDVRIYNPTLRNLFSGGMPCVFTLTFQNGDTQQVTAYNPTLILDGIGFRSEYAMTDQLCDLAHTIADTQFKK